METTRRTRRTLVLLLTVCAGAGVLFQCPRMQTYRVPLLRTHTSRLRHTVFVSHLHAKMVPGKNLIYCGTFQLAWNALMKLVGGPVQIGPVRIEPGRAGPGRVGQGPTGAGRAWAGRPGAVRPGVVRIVPVRTGPGRVDPVLEMARRLNAKTFAWKDIDPKAVTVSLKPDANGKRFRIKTTMKKNLKFAEPFTRMNDPIYWKQGKQRVPLLAFGLEHKNGSLRARQARQVSVVHYGGAQDYVVALKTKSPGDLLVLARIPPGTTLMETYRRADGLVRKEEARSGGKVSPPGSDDGIAVPFFNFHLEHDYTRLIRRIILNKSFNGWFFQRAHQQVRLRLDEKGAVLRSESDIAIACSAPPPPPRMLAFNAPFLLYMRQKNSDAPYLVLWVGHPEILVSQGNPK